MAKTIKIVTDSSCHLSMNDIERFGLMVIPVCIQIGKDIIKESANVNLTSIGYKINAEKMTPKVINPSVDEFFKTYSLVYPRYNNILSIHIASGISDIVKEAKNAQALLYDANIEVVDSTLAEVSLKPMLLKIATLAMNQTPQHIITSTLQTYTSGFSSFVIASHIKFLQQNTPYQKRGFLLPILADQRNRYLFSSSQGNLFMIDKMQTGQVIEKMVKVIESTQKQKTLYLRIQYALDKELAYALADALVTRLDVIIKGIDQMSVSSMCRFGTQAVSVGFTTDEDFFEEYVSNKQETSV